MQSKTVSGHFIARAAAYNVDIGFIPDYVKLWTALGATELKYEWYKVLEDAATSGRYGILDTAGAKSTPTTEATGIIAYNASILKAMLIPPSGGKNVPATIYGDFAYAKAQNLTPTARTTVSNVMGSIIRPTLKNGFLYECTASGGGMSGLTEPTTWPTIPGETVSDGSNTWTCRNEKLKWVGGKGFTVGVTVANNGEICCFKAETHDRAEDMGDADTSDPVSYGNES